MILRFSPLFFLYAVLTHSALAWDNHPKFTSYALQSFEKWEKLSFEPLQAVLPALSVEGKNHPASLNEFITQLNIQGDKVQWNWNPRKNSAYEILVFSSGEPDQGMDDNLKLSPDQEFMGGYTGESSRGIRHMFYRTWDWRAPLITFHIPCHEMGQAPDRAQLYFDLASQAKQSRHLFWAYRFLGWGLHYFQDLTQPYHTSQVGSMRLLPLFTLFKKNGKNLFIEETTRRVKNFHLSFEDWVDEQIDKEGASSLALAFQVPRGNQELKNILENQHSLSIKKGAHILATVSSFLIPDIISSQNALMGNVLFDLETHWSSDSRTLLDAMPFKFDPHLTEQRQALQDVSYQAVSNAGVATRWFVEEFLVAP